jgi:hypothetical protein
MIERTTLGGTPLDEWSSARRKDLSQPTTHTRQTSMSRQDSNPQSQQASDRRDTPYTSRPSASVSLETLAQKFVPCELYRKMLYNSGKFRKQQARISVHSAISTCLFQWRNRTEIYDNLPTYMKLLHTANLHNAEIFKLQHVKCEFYIISEWKQKGSENNKNKTGKVRIT